MRYLLKKDAPVNNLQVFLRTISREYPEIPNVIPDGVYGDATQNAVRAFQRNFRLEENGITDYSTWYHIVRVYNEIEKRSDAKPVRVFPEGGINSQASSYKSTILLIQSMIFSLSEIFSNIPRVHISGVYDDESMEAVKIIQELSGQNPNGEISVILFNSLSSLYETYVSADRVGNYNENITGN